MGNVYPIALFMHPVNLNDCILKYKIEVIILNEVQTAALPKTPLHPSFVYLLRNAQKLLGAIST